MRKSVDSSFVLWLRWVIVMAAIVLVGWTGDHRSCERTQVTRTADQARVAAAFDFYNNDLPAAIKNKQADKAFMKYANRLKAHTAPVKGCSGFLPPTR